MWDDNISTEQLNAEARNYAIKIVKFCSNECKLPSEKYQFSPPASTVLSSRLKAFIMSALDLKTIIETGFEEAVDKITPAVLTTIKWTAEGYDVFSNKAGDFTDSYPNSHFLAQFGLQNKDDSFVNEVIHEAYYFLCLNDLADYEKKLLNSFMAKENFETQELKIKSYEITISSIGSLICAQDAFERGQSSRWYSAGLIGQEALKEEHKKIIESHQSFNKDPKQPAGIVKQHEALKEENEPNKESYQLFNKDLKQLAEIVKQHEVDKERKAKGGRNSHWKAHEKIILECLNEYKLKIDTPKKITHKDVRGNIRDKTGLEFPPSSTYHDWYKKFRFGERLFK